MNTTEKIYKIFEDWFYNHNLQCYEEYLDDLKIKFYNKKWYSEEELRNKLDDIKILYKNGDIGFDEIADILLGDLK